MAGSGTRSAALVSMRGRAKPMGRYHSWCSLPPLRSASSPHAPENWTTNPQNAPRTVRLSDYHFRAYTFRLRLHAAYWLIEILRHLKVGRCVRTLADAQSVR